MTELRKTLPEGKYWDCLKPLDGQQIDFGWRSNVVVNECRQLIAAFFRGEAALGIQYIALGRGDPVWDSTPDEAPTASTTTLVDTTPITIPITDAAMSIEFIDSVGNAIAGPSSRIMVTTEIAGNDLVSLPDEVYPLREFGLFGELNTADFMIDYVRHPVMNIVAGDELTRRVRLVF